MLRRLVKQSWPATKLPSRCIGVGSLHAKSMKPVATTSSPLRFTTANSLSKMSLDLTRRAFATAVPPKAPPEVVIASPTPPSSDTKSSEQIPQDFPDLKEIAREGNVFGYVFGGTLAGLMLLLGWALPPMVEWHEIAPEKDEDGHYRVNVKHHSVNATPLNLAVMVSIGGLSLLIGRSTWMARIVSAKYNPRRLEFLLRDPFTFGIELGTTVLLQTFFWSTIVAAGAMGYAFHREVKQRIREQEARLRVSAKQAKDKPAIAMPGESSKKADTTAIALPALRTSDKGLQIPETLSADPFAAAVMALPFLFLFGAPFFMVLMPFSWLTGVMLTTRFVNAHQAVLAARLERLRRAGLLA